MNTEIRLPTVESCSMEGVWQGDGGVDITVSIDSSAERRFGHGLRLIAERYDPQQFDEELSAARLALERVSMLKHAIEHVLRFYDAGDRGTALHEAVRYLKQTVVDVDVL